MTDIDTDTEMLTITEAAELLRKPVATLRYWRHLGEGPRSFKVGRHVRYWRRDVLPLAPHPGQRSTAALIQRRIVAGRS